ncbi:MAG: hypothetical protein WBX02_14430 [Terriglobales bacterium]
MLPDYAAMILALAIITLVTLGMILLAMLFLQRMLDIGQLLRGVPVARAEKLLADDAAILIPARELAGD